ncbi:MAG: DHA2 family efflux MFS transporter permease subunit [Bacillota bacterium]
MNNQPFPWAGLFVLVMGAFMAILDGSIVNVALPKLMAIFGVSPDQIQWVMTGYLLTSGVVVPVTGFLGDKYGYKKIYIYSLAAFTVGSALCGVAWNNDSLIVFRVIQALGGGMLIPLSMAILYRMVPRQKIGMAMGMWGIAATMAPAVGPTLGGYLVDHYSWHLIFTINIPVGVIAVILSYLIIEETPVIKDLKFDMIGCLLCCAGLFALLLALSEGQEEGWTSQYIVTLFAISLFLLVIFCLWELYIPHPMLDIRLFTNRVFTASIIAMSMTSVAMFAAIFLVPIYCQNLQGLTPMQTGLLMMPMALVTGLMMPISGKLFDKIGAFPLGVVGMLIAAFFTYRMSFINLDTSYGELQTLLMLRASGLGLCMMPLSTAGLNTIPPVLVGRASAINNLFRQISASLGIAYMTYIMLERQAQHAVWLSEGANWSNWAAVEAYQKANTLASSVAGPAAGQAAGPGYLSMLIQKQSMVQGIGDAMLVGAIIAVFTIPCIFMLTRNKVEEARQEAKKKYAHLIPGGFKGGPPQGVSVE